MASVGKPGAKKSATRRASPAHKSGRRPAARASSLEEARRNAIDSLVETIEEAERKLAAVKRAATLDALRACGFGH
jgi:hypothetical protein